MCACPGSALSPATASAEVVLTVSRTVLTPADLADPQLLVESRGALDELTQILGLGGGFYPFQRG